LATVVPSDCRQDTVRVWVSAIEQVFESLPQVPAFQEYVQVAVLEKVPVSAPSVPQLKPVVGVQASVEAGAVVVQLLFATVVPSLRVQLTVCAAEPEFAFATQVPLRVWVSPVPQPVVGAQVV